MAQNAGGGAAAAAGFFSSLASSFSSFKNQERDSYWRSMQKYVGADITSMVTLPVLIFEPMTMLQKMAELMEYSHLLELAGKCEDPYMRLVYTASWFISVYYALQRTWKPFNPILGETYEMVNHCGITFIAEQVSHHPPISAAHAENEHFVYDMTSKVKTKFLGNSLDVYPLGRTRLKLKKDGVILDLVNMSKQNLYTLQLVKPLNNLMFLNVLNKKQNSYETHVVQQKR
ncbi:hypothetical protein R6Q57_025002 [Mikania cordata]